LGRFSIIMTGIILQARMASTRLPGKVLKRIGDKSLLDHIFFRLTYLKHKVKIVLATSDTFTDDVIEEYCLKKGVDCFRGSEQNVLERYYLCAKEYSFQHIIRLTGDNPFTDMEELDKLIDLYEREMPDLANSFSSLPIGVGAEIFTFDALERSYLNGKEPHHLEHVDEYILGNPAQFNIKILTVTGLKNKPDVRLTVDTAHDHKLASFIVEKAKDEFVKTEEAIQLCSQFA
jgi:spore coat polysaccharide biosynthesis protein SpsF